jgi:hypothetical protein
MPLATTHKSSDLVTGGGTFFNISATMLAQIQHAYAKGVEAIFVEA